MLRWKQRLSPGPLLLLLSPPLALLFLHGLAHAHADAAVAGSVKFLCCLLVVSRQCHGHGHGHGRRGRPRLKGRINVGIVLRIEPEAIATRVAVVDAVAIAGETGKLPALHRIEGGRCCCCNFVLFSEKGLVHHLVVVVVAAAAAAAAADSLCFGFE